MGDDLAAFLKAASNDLIGDVGNWQPAGVAPLLDAPGDVRIEDVRKMSMQIAVPNELLMDYGIIPDTREPSQWKQPFRWRVKMIIWDVRHKAAWLAYRVITGTSPEADYGGDGD